MQWNKKEWIWVSSSEVDETRACYTEASLLYKWSKLEREKQNIVYYHICMESRKMGLMNLFAGQELSLRHRE